jgi:hypothetical protein
MRDAIVRWDPFRDLVSIRDEMSRLFDKGVPTVEVSKVEQARPRKVEIEVGS